MMGLETTTIWIIVGLVLIISEMLTLGFFLLFIALGCFSAALVSSLGLGFIYQGATCAIFSVVGVLVFRKTIQNKLLKSTNFNADMGKEILIEQTIPPHQQTRIPYQGTSWEAINVDSESLVAGNRAVIVGVDGNILLIRKNH